MIVRRYWTGGDVSGSSVTSMPEFAPLAYLGNPATADDDTLQHSVWFWELHCRVGTSGRPPQGWWEQAKVYAVGRVDPDGVFNVDGIDGDVNDVLAFAQLTAYYYGDMVNGPYDIIWRGPEQGVSSSKSRKGFGLGTVLTPYVYWRTFDVNGVFNGGLYSGCHFNPKATFRTLFGSTHP